MDKTKLARKLMFLTKAFLFVTLASVSLNVFAHHRYARCFHPNCCYSSCNTCDYGYNYGYSNCCRPVVYYRGPDCNGYYYGSDCSRIVWVPCHWDVYGNYVPGYWVAVNR